MANSSAHFIFDHSHIGLKEFGPGRTAAAVNYQTNVRKAEKVLTVNLPNHNRHALKDHINRYEASLPRKDSRVAEMFIIGFPIGMSADHRILAAQRFLWRMTGYGQSKAWACLHHNNAENPHFHAGVLDRGADGKPVLLMTMPPKVRRAKGLDATGTDTARRAWEESCNSVFEEYGYDLFVDRRSYIKRHIDKTPQKHRGPGPELEASNENLPPPIQELAPYAPTEELPPDLEEPMVPASEEEQDMDYDGTRQQIREGVEESLAGNDNGIRPGEEPETVADRVKGAHQLGKRVKELRLQRERLTMAQDARDKADERSIVARQAERQESQAREELRYHERAWGLAGFKLFGWKSPGRRQAEKAKDVWHDAADDRRRAQELAHEAEVVAAEHEAYTQEVARQIEGYADMSPRQRRDALRNMNLAEQQIEDDQRQTLEYVHEGQLYEAYYAREVSADEALAACDVMGWDSLAAHIRNLEQQHERENEVDM